MAINFRVILDIAEFKIFTLTSRLETITRGIKNGPYQARLEMVLLCRSGNPPLSEFLKTNQDEGFQERGSVLFFDAPFPYGADCVRIS
jgi:hypothetical protein